MVQSDHNNRMMQNGAGNNRLELENMNELREKAQELTGKLTLHEKIDMIHGAQLFQTAGVERLGIPPLKMSDGPMGVRQEFPGASWIPYGHTDDYVTYLPCNSALAATWNRALAYDLGSVLGEEARGRGKDVILGPGINIKRSPLCGRNFEYFSEDPYLTAEMAVPYIQGVQNWDVAACVKHFAVNSQETERLWMEAELDEETLRAIYLPAFHEAVTRGGAHTIMGAYNKLYGEYCCQSDFLLRKILREEWGYDGVVISDWGGVHDTELAAKSPLDIEMSVTCDFDQYCMAEPLLRQVEQKNIDESCIDEKVMHILMLMMRLHMLDGKRKAGAYNTPEHRAKTLEIARESVVLLKNDKKLLPLSAENMKRILVVGDNAESIHSNGGGSAEIKALYEISPLMGIKMLLGGNTEVVFSRGYCREEKEVKDGEVSWQAASLESESTKEDMDEQCIGICMDGNSESNAWDILAIKQEKFRREAMELAADPSFDTVIFVGGLNHHQDCEGNDRMDMKLPYGQNILIRELLAKRPDTVIILTGGSPVEMGEWIDEAHTLLWGWYAGMEGGTALAEVLFGKVNPSGKLPESFYKKHTDCSAHCVGDFAQELTAHYREGQFVGYRYLDSFHIESQFCFGYGLSYTEFEYSDLVVAYDGGGIRVSCQVENIGDYAGAETVQVYAAPVRRKASRPIKELKGFEKVSLLPGEKKKVEIVVSYSGRNDDSGVEILVGSSLKDIRLQKTLSAVN